MAPLGGYMNDPMSMYGPKNIPTGPPPGTNTEAAVPTASIPMTEEYPGTPPTTPMGEGAPPEPAPMPPNMPKPMMPPPTSATPIAAGTFVRPDQARAMQPFRPALAAGPMGHRQRFGPGAPIVGGMPGSTFSPDAANGQNPEDIMARLTAALGQ